MCQPHGAVMERHTRKSRAESGEIFLLCGKFGHKIPSKINRYGLAAHNNLNRSANFSQLVNNIIFD